jgi:exoribonuclease R
MYKLEVEDRDYISCKWVSIYDVSETASASMPNPLSGMFIHEDIIDENGKLIKPSSFRTNQMIPGILVLENNKTYGRLNGRLLYKCIPDCRHLPSFIIPYDNKCIQFRKRPLNKYVLFCFKEWKDKHPLGMITQVLGDADNLNVFYEYQLYCKSLMDSIKEFNKYTLHQVSNININININHTLEAYPNIEDRREHVIFSIDPKGCKDIDDAMGIVMNANENKCIVSVYIANVTLWMETLKLWNVFSERISTIYLPDRRVSMLPTILSENYASLIEGEDRFAFCMDLHISLEGYMIDKIEYKNVLVKLDKNYEYEEKALLENTFYKKIMDVTKELAKITNYLDVVSDSHEVVEFLMIMMNHQCGSLLESYKTGLFRTKHEEYADADAKHTDAKHTDAKHTDAKHTDAKHTDAITPLSNIIKIWNSKTAASYCSYENNKGHDMIGKDGLNTYVHITSPIRRLVDLINITTIQKCVGLIQSSDECERFMTKWYSKMDYINEKMKSIKRVQNDCSLLYLCSSGKIAEGEEMDCYVWYGDDSKDIVNVYIPSIKWITQIRIADTDTDAKYKNYSLQKCKVFVINDEVSLKRKVRLMIM